MVSVLGLFHCLGISGPTAKKLSLTDTLFSRWRAEVSKVYIVQLCTPLSLCPDTQLRVAIANAHPTYSMNEKNSKLLLFWGCPSP